jgi:hypothetical protein
VIDGACQHARFPPNSAGAACRGSNQLKQRIGRLNSDIFLDHAKYHVDLVFVFKRVVTTFFCILFPFHSDFVIISSIL